ncbi:MAG: JAB domain-containing protein [Desulfobacteraceae bacterium]
MKKKYKLPIYRLQLVRDGEIEVNSITAAFEVIDKMKDFVRADRENVVCLYLDAKNRIIGQHVVSVGTVNASLVHPREVFKIAILKNAIQVIVMHNHPSGNIEPSEADNEVTTRLASAGKLLGIELVDHIIVAPDKTYYSYQRSATQYLN